MYEWKGKIIFVRLCHQNRKRLVSTSRHEDVFADILAFHHHHRQVRVVLLCLAARWYIIQHILRPIPLPSRIYSAHDKSAKSCQMLVSDKGLRTLHDKAKVPRLGLLDGADIPGLGLLKCAEVAWLGAHDGAEVTWLGHFGDFGFSFVEKVSRVESEVGSGANVVTEGK